MALAISGVIDGPLSGGVPKAIELFALEDIADLSVWGLESANNGAAASGPEFKLPAVSLTAGAYFTVASEATGFTAFFGTAPDVTSSVASINGDDAIALYEGETLRDVFGEIGVDGSGEPWDYTDGWAYRASVAPSTTFTLADWTFSGADALDGETANAAAATPFPAGPFAAADPGTGPAGPVINEIVVSTTGADTEFVELLGTPGQSLDGLSLLEVRSGGSIDAVIALSGFALGANGSFVASSPTAEARLGFEGDLQIPDNTFNNVSQTYLLVRDYFGNAGDTDDIDTDDDGVIDNVLWSELVDSVALIDDDAPVVYGDAVVGPDGSFLAPGAFRDPERTGAFVQHDFSDIDSFTPTPGTTAPVINEVLASHTGTDDTEFFEIFGAPGTSLAGLSFVEIDANDGLYDFIFDFDATDALGENGFFLVGNPAGLAANYGVTPDREIGNNTLENSSATYALVETASLSGGVGDAPSGGEVVLDAVASTGGTGDFAFGAPVVGPDGSFFPAGIRRTADGVDTDSAADFEIADFSLSDENTPTSGGGDGGGGGGGGSIDDEATLISAIQGEGEASPLAGETVVVEAIVTGDFQDGDADAFRNLGGFFVMEEIADRDGLAATSEGLFVFQDGLDLGDVAQGDRVRILGEVDERFGKTVVVAREVQTVEPGAVADIGTLAVESALPGTDGREALESMLVTFTEPLNFAESFNYEQFGEATLSSGGEVLNFTQTNLPDATAYDAYLREVADRTILIDDGTNGRRADGDPILRPDGEPFAVDQGIRMGQSLDDLTAIVDFDFGAFRLRLPEGEAFEPDEADNPRPLEPADVGSDYKVASFNVLNYFTTLGSRGADSLAEFDRQTEKLQAAFLGMDADVIGLVEIENNGEAIATLTANLNLVFDTREYAFVDTGVIGTDAITTGFIYDTMTTELIGDLAILDDDGFVAPLTPGNDQNRPAVAQAFREIETGGEYVAVANHYKSKGSPTGNAADEDQGDGAGRNDATRSEASRALLEWLETDPTGTGLDRTLILGDLNAYAREAPVRILEEAGYVNTVAQFEGLEQNSYRFSGAIGTLDYALASASLIDDVTGATAWTINGDEQFIYDYNLESTFEAPVLRPQDQGLFDGANPAKSSDHDPIIVGLDFGDDEAPLPVVAGTDGVDNLFGTEADELFLPGGGRYDRMTGNGGADQFDFLALTDNGMRERAAILDFAADDLLILGTDDVDIRLLKSQAIVTFGEDDDRLYLRGEFDSVADIAFTGADALV
jgi:predicted extracellular nuclease